jgi:molecular chaperone DnaK (HSP70)
MVGGMAKIPKVQEMVQEIFGPTPLLDSSMDDAVAIGAAI